MQQSKKFLPLSKVLICFYILLNLFICGLLTLFIIGLIKFNWIYLLIGLIGFLILLIEDLKILSTKIILYDSYLIINLRFNTINKQKIYYDKIKKVTFTDSPPIIKITHSESDSPIYLYVKQFSRKQILNLIDELNSVIKTK